MEHFLSLAAYRQGLISSNIANADTPGYRTRDIDFESAMRMAMESGGAPTLPTAQEVPGLTERPDKNNVSLDREGLLLSQVQLQFQLGVQLLRQNLKTLEGAISEGKNA
jgi:flagellar basal-body rod protein FlgB